MKEYSRWRWEINVAIWRNAQEIETIIGTIRKTTEYMYLGMKSNKRRKDNDDIF